MTWRVFSWTVAVALAVAALGCSGGSAAAGGDDASACMTLDEPASCPSPPPTYSEIAPIVAFYCASANCHTAGGAERVKDFTTYNGLYADHLTIATEVMACPSPSMGMPPPGYRQPSTAQRLALITWASICRAPNDVDAGTD